MLPVVRSQGVRPMESSRRRPRGAAAVEFALLAPLILMIACEAISWSYMFSFRQALSQAVSEGARAAVGAPLVNCSARPWPASCDARAAAETAVRASLTSYGHGGLACGAGGLTCAVDEAPSGDCAIGHRCVQVTVRYPYRSRPLLGGMPTQMPPFDLVLPPDLQFTSIVQVS
jgi:Flp pilus assembly pilin Flp